MSKTTIAVKYFALGGRESLETTVTTRLQAIYNLHADYPKRSKNVLYLYVYPEMLKIKLQNNEQNRE